MGLEDYFPYIKNKERSPITINWVWGIGDGFYNILITDCNEVSVRDSTKLKKEDVNKEIDRIVNILERDRGYSVIKNYHP